MNNEKVTAKGLGYELDGVIADVEYGNGFDEVCLGTVTRVRVQLLELQAELDEAEKVSKGEAITLPISKEHAEAMLTVAMAYLEQFKKDKVE